MPLAVRTRNLEKRLRPIHALASIDLEIPPGEVRPPRANGAGKTTLVEILEGYRDRSAGEVEVLGVDPGNG